MLICAHTPVADQAQTNGCLTHHEAALRQRSKVDSATLQLHLSLHQEEKVVTLQQHAEQQHKSEQYD
jgi:hypothetical protein